MRCNKASKTYRRSLYALPTSKLLLIPANNPTEVNVKSRKLLQRVKLRLFLFTNTNTVIE